MEASFKAAMSKDLLAYVQKHCDEWKEYEATCEISMNVEFARDMPAEYDPYYVTSVLAIVTANTNGDIIKSPEFMTAYNPKPPQVFDSKNGFKFIGSKIQVTANPDQVQVLVHEIFECEETEVPDDNVRAVCRSAGMEFLTPREMSFEERYEQRFG